MARDGHINPRTQDSLRQGIKAKEIIEKLQAHILEGLKLTSTQIRAAEVLLRKVSPDLAHTSLQTDLHTELPILKVVKNERPPKAA